ncbi:lytic transglycosylase domain-containing protein [Campylobacter concisus]|uniref:Soluble lytic murein transglycosylase n=1 Tax=Campylobacter concisus ATCC 51562 TaxID=1242969 RepID=U2EQN4_9BACT|nr:lytic transglycosylase domain-containing protein [Campylobacter concisus]ERJ26376.1 Soluble lytic murein transglycosylase precursor [Campylobacter concisus ATCC 51562]
MVLLRHFSIFSLACVALLGKIYTYEELKKEPKSLAKDYYINRLINEGSYTKEQIADLSRDVFRKAGLVQKSIDKILPPKVAPSKCPGVNAKNITQANLTCQNLLTTIAFSLKLDNHAREILAANLAKTNPEKSKILLALNETNPAKAFANLNDTKSFLELFNASSPQNKSILFSESFDANFMTKLYSQKGFTNLLNDIVFNKKYEGFRRNLLSIDPAITEKNDAFTLGLNAILLGQDDIAFSLFARAKSTFERAWQRDNATFWQYQISKNESFLKELGASKDANIYSLYARDLIGGEPLEVIVPRPSKQNIENFDVSDPFLWNKTAALAKDMNATQASEFAKKFYTNESIGAYAYFMQKANGWGKQYFLMPSSPELDGISNERKSMIYALARQESLFIPSVVSTSYALGMMQFMPFLANAIGKKELKIPNFDQDDLFKTDIAFKFANHHLNYLDKFLYHPLFTAYAYNGGIGFTKKLITRDDMFKEGKFEPFLSIELVPVAETRNYGKKVLANYVIYMALTGSNIKISQLFENLTKPALTDKFRN